MLLYRVTTIRDPAPIAHLHPFCLCKTQLPPFLFCLLVSETSEKLLVNRHTTPFKTGHERGQAVENKDFTSTSSEKPTRSCQPPFYFSFVQLDHPRFSRCKKNISRCVSPANPRFPLRKAVPNPAPLDRRPLLTPTSHFLPRLLPTASKPMAFWPNQS